MDYLVYNKDDSPLYMFESSIENHKELRNLISEYIVPKYFSEDFFELVIIIIKLYLNNLFFRLLF